MKNKGFIGLIIVFVAAVLASQSLFTVDQTQQSIVIELGKPIEGVQAPGLHFKRPFIQQVEYFENRILLYDAAPTEILTKDKKNLVVDNYTKWRIINPLTFFKTVRNEVGAQSRLDDIVYAQLRVELGQHDLSDIVSTTRNEIMAIVTKKSSDRAKEYGIDVIDVRIKRADLPEQNEKHVFGRMKAERERQAKQYRSEGTEESQKITAKADMERSIILATAQKEAEQIKGEGDAKAIKIYAEAYGKDLEFFEFVRSLEAYKKTLKTDSTLVIRPDSKFLKHIK
ncbi:MAG: protease modulator HflC [Deltaproteobacteria bacterium]|nr:protease modulator HflC [Deltaproteobacteria bacterium]MBN2688806.1 protease modulator HflC [Deltaproteobacteria bacterium]